MQRAFRQADAGAGQVGAAVAIWLKARKVKNARIQSVIHARMRSNLMSGLRTMAPRREAEAIARILVTMGLPGREPPTTSR